MNFTLTVYYMKYYLKRSVMADLILHLSLLSTLDWFIHLFRFYLWRYDADCRAEVLYYCVDTLTDKIFPLFALGGLHCFSSWFKVCSEVSEASSGRRAGSIRAQPGQEQKCELHTKLLNVAALVLSRETPKEDESVRPGLFCIFSCTVSNPGDS